MLKPNNSQKNQLTPKCANLQLSSFEVAQLSNLMFNAVWYNDECNTSQHNNVIEALIDARTERNASEIDNVLQLLNKVGYMNTMISQLHDRLKTLQKVCDELQIP